ncbi:helix-turn-helix transcriptional regulator [Actinoallomurus sp. NPDC050550]|uniref:helix-turn-helix domain-containing protein n=1 Tax=Actinoallomurus sp. NPDC050550 TaxID=3154937 RepID=UPI0033C98622
MPEPHSPTVRGRKLASELRRLRERADLTTEEAAAQLGQGWSRFKVAYIERARTKPTTQAITAMLDLYGVDSATRAALMELAKNAWRRGWWTDYSDVFNGSYVALEDDATRIDEWGPQTLPGLLQTDEYAREIIRAGRRGDEANIQRRVQARMARKALLSRKDPPAPVLRAVLDEAAMRRPIGGHEVMRAQLHALLDAGRRPNVTVQVLPLDVGTHAGLDGPFIILGFPEEIAPDVAYVGTRIGDAYAESVETVRSLKVGFEDLQAAALSPEGSAELIAAIAKE